MKEAELCLFTNPILETNLTANVHHDRRSKYTAATTKTAQRIQPLPTRGCGTSASAVYALLTPVYFN